MGFRPGEFTSLGLTFLVLPALPASPRLRGYLRGIYFEHYPVLFCHTPKDSSSNSPLHLCLHRLLPLPGHTSSGSPHRLGGPVIGHLHGGPLLPRQNCGCAQHVSQTGRLLAEHGACCLRSAGSLMRARTYSWAYLYPTSRTQLVLNRRQEKFTASNLRPPLPPLWVTVSCWIAVWWHRLVRIQAV